MVGITFFFLSPGKEKPNYEGFVVSFFFRRGGVWCTAVLSKGLTVGFLDPGCNPLSALF